MIKTWQKWLLGTLTALAGGSGLVYLWMKYLLQSDDPFAVVNHPWQPYALYVHVLASPALILIFGMLWTSHVSTKIDGSFPYNRRSGLASVWTFATMAASGYLLQVLTSERIHAALVVVHIASGCAFLLAYAGHLVVSMRAARRRSQLRSAA